MAAYFVIDVTIEDPVAYASYRELVGPTLELYGGKFLARGGVTETIEGDWQSQRLVILEFADMTQFHRWYDSPEYSVAKEIRFKASHARALLIQGV
ncbi:MAG TPA: DUF1330 domain-containing protein [Ktedonobacteraceae bacterium]